MIQRFAYPVPVLSMVTNEVLNFLYETHGHRILQWNDLLLNPAALEDYAHAIFNKGAPLRNCFGFIDGTIRPICRPGENQRFVFNGHKRLHSLKFQSVAIPNGLIANMYGPVEGKKHDSGMLTDSGLMAELEGRAYSTDGQAMCLYGDPAYPLRVHLQAPYRGAQLTEQMKFFNKSMSATRVSVEWLFGDIVNYFKFVDFKRNLKIRLSSVGKMYLVCALLHNSHTCLYGNLTSEFFGVAPPTLQQYFG
ncbi:uncharacterized protein LOC114541060 [Dendronephthya gigantea]|nr:uncharacterized protein LOC114541060 [Dendronephthya gigantea]